MDDKTKFEVDGTKFPTREAAEAYVRNILNSYSFSECISPEHQQFIVECLKLTPHGIKKIGYGIDKIIVERSQEGSKGFTIQRNDGALEDFSYRKLFGERSSYCHKRDVKKAFRNAARAMKSNPGPSTHVHHEGMSFSEIYNSFLKERSLDPENIELSGYRHGKKLITDSALRNDFVKYHNERAILVEVSEADHRLIHAVPRDQIV